MVLREFCMFQLKGVTEEKPTNNQPPPKLQKQKQKQIQQPNNQPNNQTANHNNYNNQPTNVAFLCRNQIQL